MREADGLAEDARRENAENDRRMTHNLRVRLSGCGKTLPISNSASIQLWNAAQKELKALSALR